MNASDILWVPDTSTFIALKKTILRRDQEWVAFRSLEEMAVDGDLALERHVVRELAEYAYSDVPRRLGSCRSRQVQASHRR